MIYKRNNGQEKGRHYMKDEFNLLFLFFYMQL